MAQPTITVDESVARLVRNVDHIPAWRHVGEYLVDSNDVKDMSVDGSGGSPVVYSYTPPDTYDAVINRLMIFLQTASAMAPEEFGDRAVLAQGLEIKIQGVLLDVWQDNIDMYTEFFDVDTVANIAGVTADTTLHGRWSFAEDHNGYGINLPNGETFEVVINDDLSSFTELRMKIKGKLIPTHD